MNKNMNNRGQEAMFVLLLVFIAISLLIGGVFVGVSFTGNTIKDNNGASPNLQIINSGNCLNQKDQFGFEIDCKLTIKNLENRPVELTPKFECYKLGDPYDKETLSSEKDAIPSGDERTFKISYDNDGREWSCKIIDFGVTNFN